MKKTFFTLTSIFLGSIALLLSCKEAKTKVEKAEIKVQEAKQDLVESKEDLYYVQLDTIINYNQYRLEAEKAIIDQEKKIKEYKIKKAKEQKEFNDEYNKKLLDLENKNKQLKKRLAEYKDTGDDKWLNFKKEFNHDMNEFGKAFKDLTIENTK